MLIFKRRMPLLHSHSLNLVDSELKLGVSWHLYSHSRLVNCAQVGESSHFAGVEGVLSVLGAYSLKMGQQVII